MHFLGRGALRSIVSLPEFHEAVLRREMLSNRKIERNQSRIAC